MARLTCQWCRSAFDGRRDAKYCTGSCRSAAAKDRRQSRTQPQSGYPQRRSWVLTSAIRRALAEATHVQPEDAAATALARRYAAVADADPTVLPTVGPLLMQVLIELRMTPRARAAALRGGQANDGGAGGSTGPASTLDELRAKRRARRGDAS